MMLSIHRSKPIKLLSVNVIKYTKKKVKVKYKLMWWNTGHTATTVHNKNYK